MGLSIEYHVPAKQRMIALRTLVWPGLAVIASFLSYPAVAGTSPASPVRLNIAFPLSSVAAMRDAGVKPAQASVQPALRIRPRQAGDFLESLNIGTSPVQAAPSGHELDQATQARSVLVSLRQSDAGESALSPITDRNDPFEPINRLAFGFNTTLQEYILDPVSSYYLEHTTDNVRTGVRNFFSNLREPLSIASYALEGNVAEASNATARFAINSTYGVAGVYDRAAKLGYPKRPRDLEATICAYGVPAGPYIVLPVLGPATIRDAAVRITTMAIFLQAMGLAAYIPYRATGIAVQYVDVRDKQSYIEAISLDPYAAYRMLYLQMRSLSCVHQSGEDQYFVR